MVQIELGKSVFQPGEIEIMGCLVNHIRFGKLETQLVGVTRWGRVHRTKDPLRAAIVS